MNPFQHLTLQSYPIFSAYNPVDIWRLVSFGSASHNLCSVLLFSLDRHLSLSISPPY